MPCFPTCRLPSFLLNFQCYHCRMNLCSLPLHHLRSFSFLFLAFCNLFLNLKHEPSKGYSIVSISILKYYLTLQLIEMLLRLLRLRTSIFLSFFFFLPDYSHMTIDSVVFSYNIAWMKLKFHRMLKRGKRLRGLPKFQY